MASASPSLVDVIPWPSASSSTVIVYDTVESDGRFVAHHLAIRELAADGRVLWLHGGSLSEKLIRRSFKKLGWDDSPKIGSEVSSDNSLLCIQCLGSEIANAVMDDKALGSSGDMAAFILQYMQKIFGRVREWLNGATATAFQFIVFDDASTFAAIVGDVLVYQFLSSLQTLTTTRSCGLCIRCAGEQQCDPQDDHRRSGAGEMDQRCSFRKPAKLLETRLTELVDYAVDVVPLAGGPSRDVHGRLLFTSRLIGEEVQSTAFNYSLQDSKVSVIRVHRR